MSELIEKVASKVRVAINRLEGDDIVARAAIEQVFDWIKQNDSLESADAFAGGWNEVLEETDDLNACARLAVACYIAQLRKEALG